MRFSCSGGNLASYAFFSGTKGLGESIGISQKLEEKQRRRLVKKQPDLHLVGLN